MQHVRHDGTRPAVEEGVVVVVQRSGRRAATRRDVAEAAGVSVAVVSYTLSGRAPVAPATARRVREAIDLLGYTPNQAARALKSGTSDTLALIVPQTDNPFFAELSHAVEVAAARRGFALYMTTSPAERPVVVERFREFAARQVAGVLLIPDAVVVDVDELGAAGLPWVLVEAPDHPGIASFRVDLHRGAHDLTRHLLEDGRRRIAFLGDLDERTDERFAGWRAAHRDGGHTPGPAFHAAFDIRSGYAAAQQLVDARGAVDAVFAASDRIAIGALRRLHESGVRVPHDIAVVSFDGSGVTEFTWPALTVLRQPVETIAENAVERIVAESSSDAGDLTAPGATLYPGELIVRDSCGPHDVAATATAAERTDEPA